MVRLLEAIHMTRLAQPEAPNSWRPTKRKSEGNLEQNVARIKRRSIEFSKQNKLLFETKVMIQDSLSDCVNDLQEAKTRADRLDQENGLLKASLTKFRQSGDRAEALMAENMPGHSTSGGQ